jgi:hypothetical protein
MIEISKNKVIFSRNTWDALKTDVYFREIIDAIEEREELLEAVRSTKKLSEFREYDKKRRSKLNV